MERTAPVDDALAWYTPAQEATRSLVEAYRTSKGRWPRDESELLGDQRIAVRVRRQREPFVLSRDNVRLRERSSSAKAAEYDLTINGVSMPIGFDGKNHAE